VGFYSGGTPSKATAEFWEGSVPWFSPKDMKQPRLSDSADHVSDSVFSKTSLRRLPPGTVAIVVRGMILAHTVPISILDVSAAINQDLKALLPRRSIDPTFLAAMLRAQHATILAQVSTSAHGTKKLDTRVLEDIHIPFPSLDEQRRIAAILDAADDLRAKRRATIAALDTLTQSIFTDMFGDCAALNAVPLSAVAQVRGGLTVNAKRASLIIRAPYLRVANVARGSIDLTEIKTIGVTHAEILGLALERDDLLLVEGHGNRDEVGRVARWFGPISGCVHQNHLIRIRLDDQLVMPVFAEHYLNGPGGRAQVASVAKTTSGLNTVSISQVRAFRVPVPPLPEQRIFAQRATAAAEHLELAQVSMRHQDALFASLQSRAFRGEL
jgi:type I restriction enzyme S subunit